MSDYSVVNHHVYGKVLAKKGKIHIIDRKNYDAAMAHAEKHNGSLLKSMAKNWIVKMPETHPEGPIHEEQHVILTKKNKYNQDGNSPSINSIREWITKAEVIALYLERYGSQENAVTKLQEMAKKLEEAFDNNEIIHKKKTIEQIRKG